MIFLCQFFFFFLIALTLDLYHTQIWKTQLFTHLLIKSNYIKRIDISFFLSQYKEKKIHLSLGQKNKRFLIVQKKNDFHIVK